MLHCSIGFTGTQVGMTSAQQNSFSSLVKKLNITEFHHGDCIGADSQAHKIVIQNNAFIILHPPSKKSKRAFCTADEVREKKDYLKRNRDIVDESKLLIATPKSFKEELRSGTWATIRYAKKTSKIVYIIWPDGNVEIVQPLLFA